MSQCKLGSAAPALLQTCEAAFGYNGDGFQQLRGGQPVVSTLVIPDLDADTFARLRAEAAGHGRSEEEEARSILAAGLKRAALRDTASETLADAMLAIFAPLGGHDFPELRERGGRTPLDFSGPEYGA
jgi:plasmid stability protein